ncbi:nicotinate (nicotinamide) nucleotide adenylyltransferase [Alicyclobacillus cycloheptanicus]|uniref:Probable nicotinate-nucleotide adenylyltransferase n=1 Tax=Alicyclobacillus cycloheptanicus TaxID=1457 RepID=A0ABT9XKC1_9BACL|nr:nicotinate (nicotinamide) nucleotide adenylyltransferase [Alicyclobacillus cycloheptanicus]MDQ0190504.1 nicotinate-nucleotide adenylyltransferase [Alicyclobacillus cycloheptanicus]WDM00734.1 nicotinate (nicotinamide) nucleotide adenylyltransferase [Alicyclobacillus cycloheptanicus]
MADDLSRFEDAVILFGGTFDPPHVGHLVMAQLALEQTGAASVWFLPAPEPPHKARLALPFQTRVALVEALVANYPRLAVSTIEADLPRPSYTVDTVQALQEAHPAQSFVFLIGADSLAQLPGWHQADVLTRRVPFLVAARSGFPFAPTLAQTRRHLPHIQATAIEMPILDVSSTWIRARWEAGQPVCGLVPEPVQAAWRKWRGEAGSNQGIWENRGDQI